MVYLVEHQTLLKRFAAKVLSSDLASSEDARARFTQEAHAASQLDHENIVTISDFGVTVDHRPFFVMELLRGQTLDERLADGPMTIEEVVAVAVPVARALAHAHAEGIVHRDVKPENIFLVQRSQGRWGVKVVDFGIAKTPVNPKLTNMNETLGSPLFMAPETIRGEDDVDQRADVYSFGVLLYLMLCGRLPFVDDNLLKVMQMHLSAPVPPPRAANPSLSVELGRILERALAKRPDDRYPSMDALLIDLEAALPVGSDRLLIEAQSGAARGETPFAATLAMPRTESQRSIRTMEALRTMRVAPLPSPFEEPRLPPLRSSSPNRAVIVLGSALISGAIGVLAYRQIAATGRRGALAA
ncbi:MAG TPA: serine/threonine-protein kinase, partial [Kofleriaceae bacterium]